LYNWDWRDRQYKEQGTPWAPAWLVNAFGIDYFGNVTAVNFWGDPPHPSQVSALKLNRLARLQLVALTPETTEKGALAKLKGMASLKELSLAGCKLTDSQLANLDGLNSLESLDLSSNHRFTGAGLAHLEGLHKLRWLSLVDTHITDSGLAHLKGLKNLDRLYLTGTKITDAGLAHLSGLTRLTELHIAGTETTDKRIGKLRLADGDAFKCHAFASEFGRSCSSSPRLPSSWLSLKSRPSSRAFGGFGWSGMACAYGP
jgi:hypothetical protein